MGLLDKMNQWTEKANQWAKDTKFDTDLTLKKTGLTPISLHLRGDKLKVLRGLKTTHYPINEVSVVVDTSAVNGGGKVFVTVTLPDNHILEPLDSEEISKAKKFALSLEAAQRMNAMSR